MASCFCFYCKRFVNKGRYIYFFTQVYFWLYSAILKMYFILLYFPSYTVLWIHFINEKCIASFETFKRAQTQTFHSCNDYNKWLSLESTYYLIPLHSYQLILLKEFQSVIYLFYLFIHKQAKILIKKFHLQRDVHERKYIWNLEVNVIITIEWKYERKSQNNFPLLFFSSRKFAKQWDK